MNEIPEPINNTAKTKEECSYSLSISIGVGLAFFLGMLQLLSLACINLVIASIVTVAHFTKTNLVSVSTFMGIKIAFYASFLGSILLIIAQDMMFYRHYGTNLVPFKRDAIEAFQDVWPASIVEHIDTGIPDELTKGMIISVILSQLFVFAIASSISAAIGGSFGAYKFKRGTLIK